MVSNQFFKVVDKETSMFCSLPTSSLSPHVDILFSCTCLHYINVLFARYTFFVVLYDSKQVKSIYTLSFNQGHKNDDLDFTSSALVDNCSNVNGWHQI